MGAIGKDKSIHKLAESYYSVQTQSIVLIYLIGISKKFHTLSGLIKKKGRETEKSKNKKKPQKLISQSCGSLTSEMEVSAGQVPLKAGVVNWIRISLAALGLPSLSYGFLPMCVPASRLLLFTKMPVILVHNTLLMALFCRDYFCKVFISNKATF